MSLPYNFLSPCHFVQVTRTSWETTADHYCTHCGNKIKTEDLIRIPFATCDNQTELTIRRFKDGDVKFSEVSKAVRTDIDKALKELIDQVRTILSDNKPDVMEFDIPTGQFVDTRPKITQEAIIAEQYKANKRIVDSVDDEGDVNPHNERLNPDYYKRVTIPPTTLKIENMKDAKVLDESSPRDTSVRFFGDQ